MLHTCMLQRRWAECHKFVAACEHPGMQGIDDVVISVPESGLALVPCLTVTCYLSCGLLARMSAATAGALIACDDDQATCYCANANSKVECAQYHRVGGKHGA